MANTWTDTGIYQNIAERTGGDIYIGVVGPVRSGKSTFIRRFMEAVVIPNMENEFEKTRARDEMPQSAGGRTVMTTEPKFVPDEAVRISTGDNSEIRVKMVDCVGYMIPDALGSDENGEIRMVHTPWSAEPMPFEAAAEMGTRRVITEHATIGMLVTSDGTVGDIPRENYVDAEERIAAALQDIGKPFAIICNSAHPETPEAEALAMRLEEQYGVPVALVNCLELNAEDISHILEMVLREFPVRSFAVELPVWLGILPDEHPLSAGILEKVVSSAMEAKKLQTIERPFLEKMEQNVAACLRECIPDSGDTHVDIESIDPGEGNVCLRLRLPDALYYHILSEITALPIANESELATVLRQLAETKKEYDRYAEAIRQVQNSGYGIVMPDTQDLILESPEIVRQNGGVGVRLCAKAPSVHMIRTMMETEVHPIMGTEQQSEEMLAYLNKALAEDPEGIWDTNIFGKSLYALVNDGLYAKLANMPEDARAKFGETLSKIINEGASGLVCIIL